MAGLSHEDDRREDDNDYAKDKRTRHIHTTVLNSDNAICPRDSDPPGPQFVRCVIVHDCSGDPVKIA